MGASQRHYFKDGTLHTGGSHKMPNGDVRSGKKHTAGSRKLFHRGELPSEAAKKKARKRS